jgi:hypothetical protein
MHKIDVKTYAKYLLIQTQIQSFIKKAINHFSEQITHAVGM